MKLNKWLYTGPYLKAMFWIDPILPRKSQMVAAVDGRYIWRDRELSKTVEVSVVYPSRYTNV
jgi:hypothetical protein